MIISHETNIISNIFFEQFYTYFCNSCWTLILSVTVVWLEDFPWVSYMSLLVVFFWLSWIELNPPLDCQCQSVLIVQETQDIHILLSRLYLVTMQIKQNSLADIGQWSYPKNPGFVPGNQVYLEVQGSSQISCLSSGHHCGSYVIIIGYRICTPV